MIEPKTLRAIRNILRTQSRASKLAQAIDTVKYEGGVETYQLSKAYDSLNAMNLTLLESPIVEAAKKGLINESHSS